MGEIWITYWTSVICDLSESHHHIKILEKKNIIIRLEKQLNLYMLTKLFAKVSFFIFFFFGAYSVRKLTRSASGVSPSKLKANSHGCKAAETTIFTTTLIGKT